MYFCIHFYVVDSKSKMRHHIALFLNSYIFTGWETNLLYIHKIIFTTGS